MNLSKSRYCKGIQCPKILWLDENKSDLRDDSVIDQRIFNIGNRVGDLAMRYFGDYAEVSYCDNKSLMIEETKRLLDARVKTICEASFACNGNFCSVDILRVFKNRAEIIEVKSSTAVKEIYYNDMAFQYYVLSSCGLNISKVSIMHIDNSYELQEEGALDIHSLFVIKDCTKEILALQSVVAANIERFRKIAEDDNEPVMDIGAHCYSPYECVYSGYCWRLIPEKSIFSLSGKALRFDKKLNLYQNGIISIEQLLKSNEKLNTSARLQAETLAYNLLPKIDKEAIRSFIGTLDWPLYFLDFETMQEAIPVFKGTRPYMQIPFQFSLHIQKTPGSDLDHIEYLAEEGKDPRRELAQRLCRGIPEKACVIAYNIGFEKSRIKELAGCFNDLSPHLMSIYSNIKDLMKPFQTLAYYSKDLEGSYSIKSVLPALCRDDPELDYNELDLVHNGGEAQIAYSRLMEKDLNCEEKQKIRAALLAYCKLDTLAMVKILEKLQKMCAENS